MNLIRFGRIEWGDFVFHDDVLVGNQPSFHKFEVCVLCKIRGRDRSSKLGKRRPQIAFHQELRAAYEVIQTGFSSDDTSRG